MWLDPANLKRYHDVQWCKQMNRNTILKQTDDEINKSKV